MLKYMEIFHLRKDIIWDRLNYSLKSQKKAEKKLESREKCCDTCPEGTDKYYSLPPLFKLNCGESCISPEDYWEYKILEPALTKADTPHPCEEKGYNLFVESKTHSAGSLSVDVDLYTKKE